MCGGGAWRWEGTRCARGGAVGCAAHPVRPAVQVLELLPPSVAADGPTAPARALICPVCANWERRPAAFVRVRACACACVRVRGMGGKLVGCPVPRPEAPSTYARGGRSVKRRSSRGIYI